MTRELNLWVNDFPIPLDYFVQSFIDHTVSGFMESLEGTGPIDTFILTINGNDVAINLNGADVPINKFVTKIISNTVSGMVSSLKGVDRINSLKLTIKR